MNKLFATTFLLTCFLAYGQRDLKVKYPFLQIEKNKLEYFGGEGDFYPLFRRMDSLFSFGQGNIQILHMGGSHVQAGVLSDAMRLDMVHLGPGVQAQRGLLFPFSLAHTNTPRNLSVTRIGEWEGARCSVPRHKSRWGVCGVTARTESIESKFSLSAKSDTGLYEFKHFRLLFVNDDSSFVPYLADSSLVDSTFSNRDTGFVEFWLKEPTEQLNFVFVKKDTLQQRFLLQGIQHLSHESGITYQAIGVNGASVKSYLRCQDFPKQLGLVKPDLVIFGIGINDAYKPEKSFTTEGFVAYYDSLIQVIQETNPEARFVFITNNDSYYKRRYPNPNIFKVQEGMEILTKKHPAAYWDLFEIMGGFNSIKMWENASLAKKDKIHFTRAGYLLQAELFGYAFRQAYVEFVKSEYR